MNSRIALGKIEKQHDLRLVWPNEAQDFTPWLADNIEEIGESLGLDLETQSREEKIGGFSLDILAKDGDNRIVIIENQLNSTDHSHLGQIITYASGVDAKVIVWVAREFRDEHRQAIDWLNQHTQDETEFFGVVMELWKIGDSPLAPNFRIVAAPNDWRRETAERVRSVSLSERNVRYQTFFKDLTDTLREKGFTNRTKAQPASWSEFASGHTGVRYVGSFTRTEGRGYARVEIYIDKHDKEWNEELFNQLENRKTTIESELGNSLEWTLLPERRACRIFLARSGSIDDDETKLKELKNWMVSNLLEVKQAFSPMLESIIPDI